MKTCKYGHPRGTNPDCKACQISNRIKTRWQQPSPQMVAASQANRLKGNTSGLSSDVAAQKRATYFESQTHKDKASSQARKLAEERRRGVRQPATRAVADTKLEIATWAALDQLGVVYHKQYPVGPYLFDFFLPEHSILLEVDGEWAHSQPASITNDLAKDSYIRNQRPDLRLLRLPEESVRQPALLLERLGELTKTSTIPIIQQNAVRVEATTPDMASTFLARHNHLPKFRRDTRIVHAIWHSSDLIGILIYTKASGSHLGTPSRWCLELNRLLFAPGYESLRKTATTLSLLLMPEEHRVVISRLESPGWIAEYGYWCTKLSNIHAPVRSRSTYLEATCGKCGGVCSVSKEAFRKAVKKHGSYYHHSCRMEMKWKDGTYADRVKRSNVNLVELVDATCGCGKSKKVQRKSLLDAIRNHGKYRCISCGVKAAHEIKLPSRKQPAGCGLAENNQQDVVKQGQKMAQSELHGHSTDPAGLYSHIVKGLTYTRGLIVADEAYWQQMFAYWPHVTPEQKNEIFEKITESVSKRLQAWQQTGQLQEGAMGAIGNAVGGAVNWVGRQITNFAQFIAKIKTILDAGQGRQTTPGQRQQQAAVYSRLNGDSVIGFTDQCLVASQKNLKEEEATAKNSASPQQPESGSGPPRPDRSPGESGSVGQAAAPGAGPVGSGSAPGILALTAGRS